MPDAPATGPVSAQMAYHLHTRLIEAMAVIRGRLIGGDANGALAAGVDAMITLDRHWLNEGRLMRQAGMAAEDIAAHEEEHESFGRELSGVVASLGRGSPPRDAVLSAMIDRAIAHTTRCDLPMLARLAAGRRPELL